MSELPNVVIVIGRCSRNQQRFGIRFEQKGRNQWDADWAFKINESAAKRERYDQSEISGLFSFGAAFPGCPYCGSMSFYKCGCGKIACWDAVASAVTCPWCRSTGKLGGAVESLGVGRDR
jgi:TerY-C metal binding domain